jgi:uncharacterized protein YbaP (TraB family)
MKKILSIFTIAFLLLSSCSSTKKATAQEENSLFWEISGKELKEPSYLFGTIHIICRQDYFMPEMVKQKFASSKNVFLEMDMDDPKMQMKMMQLAMLPKGESLPKLFGKDYALVDSFFKKNTQFPLAMFNQFKPMMIMSLLTMETLTCEDTESYETNFMGMAKKQGKDIKGLETIEDQMRVFDNIPDSVEVKNIVKMVKEFDEQKKQFAEMVNVYKEQNISKLQQELSASPDTMGAEDELLTKRNNNWIPVMEKNMKEDASFFAVGAGHLAGKNGVIQLLRKAGYTVKAVNTK